MPNNTHARQSPRYCHECKSISAAGEFNRYEMPASRLSFFGFKLTGLSMKTWCMFVAFATLVLVGCDGRQSEPTPSSSAPPAVASSTPPKDRPPAPSIPSPQVVGGLEIGRTYNITSKADLREGPSGTAAKKVNQKASDILKAIHYMSVDSSVTVRVLDVKSEWVEIQIIEPEHLSATHRGWIPKSSVQGGQSSAKVDGWIRHTARVYRGKSAASDLAGYLSPPASVGVADDGSGWLRLVHGPIKAEGSNRFVDNPDFDSGLYIQADKFTTVIPSKWGK